MLQRLKNMFDSPVPQIDDGAELKLAAAALLAHAAHLDGNVDNEETATLLGVLQSGFELSAEEASSLLELAMSAQAEANDLYRWTKVINAHYDEAQKTVLVEKLWMIVLADGRLDDYEANLLRRVAGLIHVPDQVAGVARKRAAAALES